MSILRAASLGSPFVLAAVLVAACGRPPEIRSALPTGPATAPGEDTAHATAAPAKVARSTRKARAVADRPAPPKTTTPMAGEPSPSALAEARLVPTTCEDVDKAAVEAKVKAMRAAVEASFRTWHDEQPACWEADRERDRWRRMEDEGGGLTRPVRTSPKMLRSVAADSGYGGGPSLAAASPPAPAPSAAPPAAGRAASSSAVPKAADKGQAGKAESMSGTNNQVASVDEADIVKTDGRYVYFAANGALRIAEALDPKMVSVTKLPGSSVREMFVEGDRAVVYTSSAGAGGPRCTYGYDCAFGGDGSSTSVVVLDVSDRKAPRIVRQIDLSGSLIAARRIGSAVHTVVSDGDRPTPEFEAWPSDLPMCGTNEPVVRQKFVQLKAENEKRIRAKDGRRYPTITENGSATSMCNGLMTTAIADAEAYTSLVSFDLKDEKAAPTTATVRTRSGAVFASEDALYVAVGHQKANAGGRWYSYYPSVDEVSEVHKFRIGASPKTTRYVGSGTVPGHVLSQLSMDEWSGYLRVATTKGKVPDPRVESVVSVLAEGSGGNLVRVGAVDHIAPSEDIRAVRFDDDRAYVVTFKKTDPLFVLDMHEPAKPSILGELKIPGFSTYIHRIDPDHLLSIGFDAHDQGSFAFFDGVILQLFDVSKPTDPRLLHKEKIGTRGSSSAAATDHLAFNYFADRGLLAIPMTVCEGGGVGVNGQNLAFSGLYVYDVDLERGFTRLGGVDHGAKGATCGTWWSNASSTVKRSLFLDDLVYSVAGDRAKVQRLEALGEDVADLSLVSN